MLELERVSKRFAASVALHPTSVSIPSGQTCVLIGPSGCGKSTLLRIAIGLVRPDAGTVRIAGQQLHRGNELLLRRRIGYVIQDGGLFPHLTARRNASLVAGYLGWAGDRISARLGELTELTRFPADALDRYPGQLSGGQRQRVALMRALFLDPDVVLLDEPLGALDPMIRSELQADLRQIFRTLGKTVLMVTHDMAEAAFFGDNIVLLRDGRIVQQGSLRDFTTAPADPFVSLFLRAQRPLQADMEWSR